VQNSNSLLVHSPKIQAAMLRNALSSIGHLLDESTSLNAISELNNQAHYTSDDEGSDDRLQIAERFLDDAIEARESHNFEKLSHLFEQPYRDFLLSEREFKQGLRRFDEDLGSYVSRTYFGSIKAVELPERVGKYPNCTRHVWRGQFEKAYIVIRLGVYQKNGDYYLNELRFSYR